jgi:hypothetical protein
MPLTALGGPTGTVVVGDVGTVVFPQILHPNVFAYIDAQASIGYQMTRTEIDAINNLVWGLVGTGLWDKLNLIYPFIGSSLNAQKWNLKDVANYNIAFTGTAFTTSTANGLQKTTTATTSYGSIPFNVRTLLSNTSYHISCYVGTSQSGATASPFGAYAGVVGQVLRVYTNTTSFGVQVGGATGVNTTLTTTGTTGYVIGTRTAINACAMYIAGLPILRNTTTASATTLPNAANIDVGLMTQGFTFVSTQAIRMATVGSSLTDSDAANLNTLVQAFQTKLGRQV